MKVHHACIETSKYDESIFFYTKVLNFSFKNKERKESIPNDKGFVHICFFVEDIFKELERIKLIYNNFKLKNNEILYNVEGGNLFKLIAPEGTIIEIRDNPLF